MFAILGYTLLALFCVKLYLHFSYWSRQGIPNRPYPMLTWMFMPVNEFLYSVRTPHKIFGGFKFLSKLLVLRDAKIIHDFSVKELHKFPVRFDIFFGRNSLAKSLFFMEANHDWKRIRNVVTPAFTSGKLKAMMEPIGEISDVCIGHLRKHAEDGKEFDIKRYLDGFTMDVISRCAYGIKVDSLSQPNHPIILNARQILNVDLSLTQFICIMFSPLAKLLGLEFFYPGAVKYFDNLTNTIIEKRKNADQNKQSDFIGLMMKEIDTSEARISPKEMSAQSVLFFIAGYDTTNAAMDHVLYYLGKHPQWQEKLYDELRCNELTYENLSELPILNAIIYETLRLAPSLTSIERVAKEDCTLLDTGIRIPAGTPLAFHPFMVHRDEDYFENPEEFLPERFIGTNLESSVAYMPFGVGSRFCVGMRFALNELRIGVSKFFTNYSLTIRPDFELEYFRGSILLSPKSLRIKIESRDH